MSKYQEFLKNKSIVHPCTGIPDPAPIHLTLFDFQAAIVRWALKRGRAAIFAQTGLGKTGMQCEYARHVTNHTGLPVLILAPLAVASQTIVEAKKLIDLDITFAESGDDILEGVYITNYGKLHKFDFSKFGGVILDESAILKNESGATRNFLVEACQEIPFRLACTAVPAPNDQMELGNHSEFLGVMSMSEMLAMFFVHDGGETQKWRLKGHAESDFWKWMASWSVCVQSPRDLGFDGSGYDLPPLRTHEVIVKSANPQMDGLFIKEAGDMNERRAARKQTISERVAQAASLDDGVSQMVLWCNLNDESKAIAAAIPGAVEVTGSDSDDHKEKTMLGFAAGKIRVMVSKASICGYGMNFQNCHKTVFVGLNDSYEQIYQAVRRFWRFGQKEAVDCWIVISDQEGRVLENIKRKEEDSQKMQQNMVIHMAELTKSEMSESRETKHEYVTGVESGPGWTAHLGDCVQSLAKIESDSIGYTIYSPPFESLYTYSASNMDMGNSKDSEEFMTHYKFLLAELYRVTMPGRLLSFHCMNLATSKVRDGFIGIRDFRGELIRATQEAGFIFHSEVCIWTDPVTAMQRTKAIGLLHKTIRKDSSMSRQGIPDYLVTMRKPGDNPIPVNHYRDEAEMLARIGDREPTDADHEKIFPVQLWQQYASPVWMDICRSDTLQHRSAREHQDERHICPLQLEVIERALLLWTNKDDLVLSPFMGIGSEGYVARKLGRRFVGTELKGSYFRQACANLAAASTNRQIDLFEGLFDDPAPEIEEFEDA